MDIHIVCRDLHEDKILPRLALSLARGSGWSLSDQPRKDASLNYWMIYIDLAERHSDWRHTPRAAYFSHYEAQTPFKRMWWENAAALVDGCILTAAQYGADLPQHKPKFICRPPIDRELFNYTPGSKIYAHMLTDFAPKTRPVVGVSGFVDRSGRKGEWMVKRLVEELGDQIDFVGCGTGWPEGVKTRLYPYHELPAFYYSLDALLCTSNVEGIPMPPLEALACGTSVVIPRGVGLLDTIAEHQDVYRYNPSNYDDMKEQLLKRVLGGDVRHRLEMTELVSDFNAENWHKDHKQAFREILTGAATKPAVTVESDRHGSRGVFYVAYGKPARDCARGSIESFKQHMPNIPVALVSDQRLGPEDVFISHRDEDIGGRSAKTKIYELAPKEWGYVMYLDSDTEIIADISFLFELVESGFDLVICKNPGKYHTIRYMERSDNGDECQYTFNQVGTDQLIQLNGGVFIFARNARTEAFFQAWHTEWMRWGKRDQGALIRALFQHPLKMNVLTNTWNTITRYEPPSSSAGILHYPMTARRWRGIVTDRLDSQEAWSQVSRWESERGNK